MSELKISQKFKNVLKGMRGNKFAERILALENKEITKFHNYIDISDTNDIITFIPESKVSKLLEYSSSLFELTNNERYLKKFSKANIKIFSELGYEPGRPSDDDDDDSYVPSNGTIGRVLKEAVGEVSGNTYCLFEHNGNLIVYNKLALNPHKDSQLEFIGKNRNSIKIGRYINSIFKDECSSRELECFVNEFKASYSVQKDDFFKFKIVEGDDISYWYDGEKYLTGGGPLNNSCMAKSDKSYFDIYAKNPLKMVILHTEGGYVENGEYFSDKIRGRALLWEDVTMGNKKITFLDRVYTTHDSDVEFFKQLAIKNGWWYKKNQSMETYDTLTNGVDEVRNPSIYKVVDNVRFDRYPFMDTLCFINLDNKVMSNTNDKPFDYDRRLRSTGGGWE